MTDDRWEVSPDVLAANPDLADYLKATGRNNGETSPPKRKRKRTRKKLDDRPDLEGAFYQQWVILQKWFQQEHGVSIPDPVKERRFYGSKEQWRNPRRFDFSWEALNLVVEIEGGTWVKGAHVRGARFTKDAEKYNEAAIAGWYVLRFSSDMIEAWTSYKQVREWMLFRIDRLRKLYENEPGQSG